MKRIHSLVITSLFLLGAACGGKGTSTENPQPGPAPADKVAAGSPQASCEAMFAKASECTDDYLPALVDLRISLDMPAGIAQAAETEGRDALIAKAREEWATDSQPANATAACQAILSKMAAEDSANVSQRTDACVAEDSCSGFVSCIIPLHEEMFRSPSHQPGHSH